MILIRRHQKRIARWRARFELSDYQIFWMGFGEGLLIGAAIGIFFVGMYMKG